MKLLATLTILNAATVLARSIVLDDEPYCSQRYRRLCMGKGIHVACQYPPGPGEICENYTEIKFNVDLRHFITHYINKRRQKIASGQERGRGGLPFPKPDVMMYVEWDRELAYLAQRLADQCLFTHDECRATVRFPFAGQTVGEVRWRTTESDELTAMKAIRKVLDAWWGERRRVDPKQLSEPFRLTARGTVWGHFSQLTVWSLRAVGCGAVRHGVGQLKLLLVCDFSHTNMLGQKTLNAGSIAPCPAGSVRRPHSSYPLLCAMKNRHPEHRHDDTSYSDLEQTEVDADLDYDELKIRKSACRISVARTQTNEPWSEQTRTKHIEIPKERSNKNIQRFHESYNKKNIGNFYHTPKKLRDGHHSRERLTKFMKNEKDFDAARQYAAVDYDRNVKFDSYIPKVNEKQHYNGMTENEMRETLPLQERQYHENSAEDDETEKPIRRNWQQTRNRPRRPGADALLASTLSVSYKNLRTISRRPTVALLTLDKDDVYQLFRDTGFSVGWRNNKNL